MKKIKEYVKSQRSRLLKVFICAMAMCMTMVTAFAEGESATGMDAVLAQGTTLASLVTMVWTLMTSNPLLTLFLAVGLVGVGVAVFRMIKRAARR